jgi:hypothetical protein
MIISNLMQNTSLITYCTPSTFQILLVACEKSKWRRDGIGKAILAMEASELYGWRYKGRERALRLKGL